MSSLSIRATVTIIDSLSKGLHSVPLGCELGAKLLTWVYVYNWFQTAQKTDLGVQMGVCNDGGFKDINKNVIEGHYEGQNVKLKGQSGSKLA